MPVPRLLAPRPPAAAPAGRASSPEPPAPFDPTFGVGGVVSGATASLSNVSAPVLLAGGRIALTGYVSAPQAGHVVAVLDAGGHLDPSFGVGGRSMLRPGGHTPFANTDRIAVQPDGKLIVGTVVTGPDGVRRWSLSRTRASGGLDPSFSGDGLVGASFAGPSGLLILAAVLLRPDGRILAVGSTIGSKLLAVQYLPNGSLDRPFGTEGRVEMTLPGSDLNVSDAVLDAQGRFVVAATGGFIDSADDLVIARFRPDGSLDPTFGFQGTTFVDFGIGDDAARRVALDADGRIVVAGTARSGPEAEEPALVRLRPDGALDLTFGESGLVRIATDKHPDRHRVGSLAVLGDGRLALAGHYELTDEDRKDDPDYRRPQPFVVLVTPTGTPHPSD